MNVEATKEGGLRRQRKVLRTKSISLNSTLNGMKVPKIAGHNNGRMKGI